jgi:hypothetical protein
MFVLVRHPGKCQYHCIVKVTLKSEQIRQWDANEFIQLKKMKQNDAHFYLFELVMVGL